MASLTDPPLLRKAAFLDRDGVVNVDVGYLCARADLVWVPGAPEAIGALNASGYDVFIVTNQSGIARGLYSEAQYLEFAAWVEQELGKRGATISETLYCPHHPSEGRPPYKQNCLCRKPGPGMLLQVLDRGIYDLPSSFLIGDKESDLIAAEAAGIDGYLFDEDNLEVFVRNVLKGRSRMAKLAASNPRG